MPDIASVGLPKDNTTPGLRKTQLELARKMVLKGSKSPEKTPPVIALNL